MNHVPSQYVFSSFCICGDGSVSWCVYVDFYMFFVCVLMSKHTPNCIYMVEKNFGVREDDKNKHRVQIACQLSSTVNALHVHGYLR